MHTFRDEYPDLSWLEQEGFDEDGSRRASYGETWTMVGVKAVAHLEFNYGGASKIGDTISSPGLWGTESDSGADYFLSLFAEQLDELANDLEALGLEIGDAPVRIVSTTENPEEPYGVQFSMVDR